MAAKKEHPDAPFVTEVVEQLAPFGAVSVRAMFGGHGLYVDGAMFALVADGALYLKVDGESREAFAAAGQTPFVYEARGNLLEMSYWTIPDDAEALRPWFERARGSAMRTAMLKKRRPKR